MAYRRLSILCIGFKRARKFSVSVNERGFQFFVLDSSTLLHYSCLYFAFSFNSLYWIHGLQFFTDLSACERFNFQFFVLDSPRTHIAHQWAIVELLSILCIGFKAILFGERVFQKAGLFQFFVLDSRWNNWRIVEKQYLFQFFVLDS